MASGRTADQAADRTRRPRQIRFLARRARHHAEHLEPRVGGDERRGEDEPLGVDEARNERERESKRTVDNKTTALDVASRDALRNVAYELTGVTGEEIAAVEQGRVPRRAIGCRGRCVLACVGTGVRLDDASGS